VCLSQDRLCQGGVSCVWENEMVVCVCVGVKIGCVKAVCFVCGRMKWLCVWVIR